MNALEILIQETRNSLNKQIQIHNRLNIKAYILLSIALILVITTPFIFMVDNLIVMLIIFCSVLLSYYSILKLINNFAINDITLSIGILMEPMPNLNELNNNDTLLKVLNTNIESINDNNKAFAVKYKDIKLAARLIVYSLIAYVTLIAIKILSNI